MRSEWKTFSVQELVNEGMLEEPKDGNHGNIHPKTSDYVSQGIPFIMANDLINSHVDYEHCAFITKSQANTLKKGFSHPGDVLITHKATIGRTAIVGYEYETIILTPQVTYYRVKKGISNRYLKYYFDSSEFQQIFANWAGAGSTRAYLGITAQQKLPIVLPPYDIQLKIAGILGAIDDKIELNNAINNNLEQQTQAIFEKEFLSTQTLPEGWKQASLIDIADYLNGLANDISFVAPTSFGKSELIVRHIKKVNNPSLKAAIIVPTKSLLMQTYKYVKEQLTDKKIILHDQMYTGEQSYIAVLTQERALRLLEKHNTYFDYLYVDEAHNLFDKDMRNRLLARLIRLTRMKNTHCEILYFSPLVEASDNLKVLGTTSISEYRIEHNIKIPTYFLYQNKKSYVYNRYFNKHYDLFKEYESPYLYIFNKATDKNLLYINAPRRMESVTLKFAKQLQLPDIDSPMIQQIVSSVKKHVHNDFQMIPLIQKGVVYLHGKLPDYVKDYIEYKAATTPEIKYISANSVLLEGINLPISSLFIYV